MQNHVRKFHSFPGRICTNRTNECEQVKKYTIGHMAMHGLLKQAAGTIRKFSVGALLALGLVNFSALANDSEVDAVIILPTPLSEISQSSFPIERRLEFALGEAMMDIGILPIVPDFLSMPPVENAERSEFLNLLQTIATQHTGRLLAVKIHLLLTANPETHPTPAASVIDVGTGRLVARTSTLPLLALDDSLEIEASATALARAIARQLEQNGYVVSDTTRRPWGVRATDYRIALEGFDLCERRELLTTMEKEFPGFLSVELVKAPNPTFAVYVYRSTATAQRLQKWLEQLMISLRIAPSASSKILTNDISIRVQKDRSRKIFTSICDG